MRVPPPSWQMSLLVFEPPAVSSIAVSHVHWIAGTSAAKRKKIPERRGRQVDIEDGRIKYSTPLTHSEINFDETPYWAVLPDVGQFMEKVKKSEREPANPQPLRLKACLETCFSLNAIEGGPGDDPLKATDVVAECFACGMGDALATCPFCLLTYHHRCVVDMAKHFECHDVSATMEPLHSVVLPGRYFNASYMCALCASSQDVLDIEGD